MVEKTWNSNLERDYEIDILLPSSGIAHYLMYYCVRTSEEKPSFVFPAPEASNISNQGSLHSRCKTLNHDGFDRGLFFAFSRVRSDVKVKVSTNVTLRFETVRLYSGSVPYFPSLLSFKFKHKKSSRISYQD